jgi:hypothetical protein
MSGGQVLGQYQGGERTWKMAPVAVKSFLERRGIPRWDQRIAKSLVEPDLGDATQYTRKSIVKNGKNYCIG